MKIRHVVIVVLASFVGACRADGELVAAEPAPPPEVVVAPEPEPPPGPDCTTPEQLAVLFIGNSYLNIHNLPQRVASLGNAAGIAIEVDKVTMGGESFEYHVGRAKTGRLLESRPWDVVVLQSHSLDPLRNEDGFFRAGAELGTRARAVGASPLLFETWARRAGHNLYNYFEPARGGPAAMQSAVTERYAKLGDTEDMPVAPVGTAWLRAIAEHPELDLFAKDGGHPSAQGAYLGACVIFSVLTRRSAVPDPEAAEGVDPPTAAILREIATDVVQPPC
ncbi:MAG: hypothetical protein AAF721_36600 [Myxococcota bacterium]